MLNIELDISLKNTNTLALEARAHYYVQIKNTIQIPEAMAFARQRDLPVLVLGSGSNVVLTGDFPGVVMKMSLSGIDFTTAKNDQVHVTAAAGENWHHLIQTCLANGYYGLENLSLIPGSVGAAPVQNIGAYGVEFAQRFESLTGWDCEQQDWRTLTRAQCEFGYRDSVFKHRLKDGFIITSIAMILTRKLAVDISYGALGTELSKRGIDPKSDGVTPQQVADAVIAIRRSKLPDPDELPNAGSFFKNPTLTRQQFDELKQRYPAIVSYPQVDGRIKLAAGWLLEQAGWRGKHKGPVGMHSAQSLVMINHGGANAEHVLALARDIQQDIQQRFGVHLEIEPALY